MWRMYLLFEFIFRHMKSLSTAIDDKTQIAFNDDGTVKDTELNILNLDQTGQWQVVRAYYSNKYSTINSHHVETITRQLM